MRFFGDIGAMDRMVTIRNQSSPVTNDYGEVTSVTNADTVVNCSYYYKGRDEANDLDKQTQMMYLDLIIRYGVTVTLQSVAIYEGASYDVINIEPIGRQKFLKITLKAVN